KLRWPLTKTVMNENGDDGPPAGGGDLPVPDLGTMEELSESSSSITSSFDQEIVTLKAEMAEINKKLIKVLQTNQQVKAVTPSCKTYGGPHSYHECQATDGHIQNVYAAGAYNQGGNTYQPKGGTFMKRRPEECYDLFKNITAHYNDWDTFAQRTTVDNTQNVYDAGAYQGNSYQPQGNRNLLSYRLDNYLRPPGFNQN
nr:reverse transcriptase domain-containing protein [Tanacetum cinerariifolium]